ncbi:DUF1365 domain-containing protein [soil metagenome]
MRSRLFACRVTHARFSPRRHRFAYRAFYMAIDLDELPVIARRFRLLSVDSANVFNINDRDFLPLAEPVHNQHAERAIASPAGASLRERVEVCLSVHGLSAEGGRVELVAMPRMLGYQFNPVSFYFCYGADGRPVATIVEVTNTFREIKVFVLGASTFTDGAFRLRVPKDFYVSPFSEVDLSFDFTLRPAGDTLRIRIDDYDGDHRTFTSALTGDAQPLTDRRLAWCFLAYPLMTARVIALIHWNALLLALKHTPWYRKGARAPEQRDLRRPHASLSSARPERTPLPLAKPI